MALEIHNIHIDAIDKSELALRNASANINIHHCESKINLCHIDILQKIPEHKYDVIVSNPPYIPLQEISGLEHSVQHYDPLDALTDYSDGMIFYRRIFKIANQLLNRNGFIVLEFGSKTQKNEIVNIFNGYKYEVYNDQTHHPRVIALQ